MNRNENGSPCYQCPDRKALCHAGCRREQEWLKAREKLRAEGGRFAESAGDGETKKERTLFKSAFCGCSKSIT